MQRSGTIVGRSSALRLRAAVTVALAAGAVLDAAQAWAQAGFPNRPMRIIVGFLPGSSNDILARFVGSRLMDRLGQQVVVDNRAGANGIIGSDLAAKANPDGHTLLLMTTSNTMTPALYKLPYDPVRSFAPVAMLGTSPLALVVNAAIPANTVKELVELARAKPGGLSYATAGAGGVNHFAAELFSRSTNVRMLHVPYKGGAPALTDVIAGQVNLMFGTLPLTLRHIQGGKVRGLGVTGSTRSPMMPELPTIAEAGVPGFELHIWWGLAAPAGTPEPIVARLNAEVGSILGQADAARRLENEGAEARPMTAAAFSKLIHVEIEKWGRVAREAGIKAQ